MQNKRSSSVNLSVIAGDNSQEHKRSIKDYLSSKDTHNASIHNKKNVEDEHKLNEPTNNQLLSLYTSLKQEFEDFKAEVAQKITRLKEKSPSKATFTITSPINSETKNIKRRRCEISNVGTLETRNHKKRICEELTEKEHHLLDLVRSFYKKNKE